AVCAKVIHDGDASVRKAATRALVRMGGGAIIGILEDVRARGQEAIGYVVDSVKAILGGDPLSAPPEARDPVIQLLVPALRDKESFAVRWAAAVALGAVGTVNEVAALEDACTFEKHEIAK